MRVALKKYDWVMTGVVFLLFSVGAIMLLSVVSGDLVFSSRFFRQLISFLIAIVIYFLFSFFPYHLLRRYAAILYVAGVALLLLVGQVASVVRGARSRFEIFGVQIQPSEIVKVIMVIFLAWLLAKWKVGTFSFLLSGVMTAFVAGLIVMEPDVGEAALVVLLWSCLVVYAGFSWRKIILVGLIGLLVFAASWFWLFADYQKERLLTFMNSASDPLGAGYNVNQSIVALGSGGMFGRGLGHGPQSQLKFLPERHTDFILASAGEELGFVGICLILGLYFTLLWRILKVVRRTRDSFGQYLAAGAFLLLLVSFFVSAGMNMGLLPVTGIPLPLISYGGSNLVGTMMMLGIVQSVKHYSDWLRKMPVELTEFT